MQIWWERVSKGPFASSLTEWIKLSPVPFVLVPGSVENERVFSSMDFIKSSTRSRLKTQHLNCALRMKVQQMYTFTDFPSEEVNKEWKNKKERHVRLA
jgi:hypothetical protein